MKQKSTFDLLFEQTLGAFGQPVADVVVVSDQPLDSESDEDFGPDEDEEVEESDDLSAIVKKLDKQFKGLKKVASGNEEGGKIYYRARNITKLIEQLKQKVGVASQTAPSEQV